jgi:hypothetical protein
LGTAVAVSGGTAVVGAWTANVGGNGDQGAGYAVELDLPDTPRIVVDPARLAVELEAGVTGTQPLTIGNQGGADLAWITVAGSDCGTPSGLPR